MAVMYIRGSGMSSEDRAREDGTVSALKEETEYAFPDGEIVDAVPASMDDGERQAVAVRVASWEKDGLIKRKQSNALAGQSLKDTRVRYGAPREWDHLQLSFDRAESDSLTSSQLEQARRAVVDVAGRDVSGVHRKMTISRIHTDTGNTHVDVFVHRHAYNAVENAALPADELTAPSRLASVIEQINRRLRALDLPPMADVKKQDGRSLYEESATSDKAKNALNEMVADAGGVPMQRTGSPATGDAPTPIQRIVDPDASALERLVRDAERDAKSAAQRLVDAQNALEAQRQRLELRERVEQLENDVVARNSTITERDAIIVARDELIEIERLASAKAAADSEAQRVEIQQKLEATEFQLEDMSSKFSQAAADRDEAHLRVTGLEADYENAQEEIEQKQSAITTLESTLSIVTNERDSEQTARVAAERSTVEQSGRADRSEAALAAVQQQLEAERVERAALKFQRDQAQQDALQAQRAAAATAEILKNERNERTKERKEERETFNLLKTGLSDTIDGLKQLLASMKDQLTGITSERNKLLDDRESMSERVSDALAEMQRMTAREQTQQAELTQLRQRVADFDGSDDNGSDAKAKPRKPPGKS